MKKHITIILSAGAMLLAGCQKQMDIQTDDRVDDIKSVYEHLSRAYDHLRATFYVPTVTGPQSGFSTGGHMMAVYCDEAQEVSQLSPVYDWYNGRVSSSKMPLWYVDEGKGTERWTGLFNCIDGCNEALKWLQDDTLVIDYEESQRKGLVSQFYAYRAYCYLQLIKRWGGVPIIKEPIGKEYDYSNDKRASFAQCVDFIIESCDAAMAYTDDTTPDGLPWFGSGSQSWQMPRLGRAALWAIKSQATLYAASPLWAEDHAGTNAYTWERTTAICKEALEQVMANGAKLVTDGTTFPVEANFGKNAYDKYFLSPYTSDGWDSETLYQPYDPGNYVALYRSRVWQYAGLPIDVGQVSAGACPTQEMVDAYEVVSGDGTKSEPLLDLSNPYNANGTPNFNPAALALGYEEGTAEMYENRDPRFYSTIYYDGAGIELANDEQFEIETRVGGNCGLNLSPSNKRNTSTGYYLRKFANAQSGADYGNKDGYIRVFRLAELYLNFAEAAFKAYGADDLVPAVMTGGTPMTAREAVNTVRARVGMPAVTGGDFELRLHNERRVELAFEEHRFFDIRRWTPPQGEISATDKRVGGIRIEESNGSKVYSRFAYERKCHTNKYLKYPVDLNEVRKMLLLTGENWQNDGWN